LAIADCGLRIEELKIEGGESEAGGGFVNPQSAIRNPQSKRPQSAIRNPQSS